MTGTMATPPPEVKPSKNHNNQNLNPNVVVATHIIVLGSWEDRTPIGIEHDTRPKVKIRWCSIDTNYRRIIVLMLLVNEFSCRISPTAKLIYLSFQQIQ
jgi:hypothetical protein